MRMLGSLLFVSVVLLSAFTSSRLPAQTLDFTAVRAEVDFSKQVRLWDGFGVNYVEVAQAIDYTQDPQEYGGFSLLTEEKRQQIVEMVFATRPQAGTGQDVPRSPPSAGAGRPV